MKTSERGSDITLNAILSFPLRYFLLPVVAAIALGGCNSGGGGSGGSSQQPTSTGTSLIVAQVTTAASPLIAVVTDPNGKEKIALVGTKDSSGAPVSVTQALYISASGDAGALEIGPDGLPVSLSDAAGDKVTLANFTNSTVDITVFDQAGNQVAGPVTVTVDGAVLSKLRSLHANLVQSVSITQGSASPITVALLGISTAEAAPLGMSTQDWIKTEVNVVGLGLGLAGCGAIAVGTTSLAGPLGLMAGAACASTLVNAAQQIVGTSPPGTDYVNAGADGFSCAANAALGDLFDCASLVVDGLGLVIPDDVTPPSVPTGLAVSRVTQTTASFSWTGSTDDVAVAGYRVYRDGNRIADVPITYYRDLTVVPGTRYCYTVLAYDAAGHSSGMSGQLCITISNAPLSVSATTPGSGATNVSAGSGVFATFSVAIDASTLNASTFTLTGPGGVVAGTVAYNASTNSAAFTPSATLAYGATYTATVTTGVKDTLGNVLLSDYTWSFTTASSPGTTSSVAYLIGASSLLQVNVSTGSVTTVATAFTWPTSIALTADGTVAYVNDGSSAISGTVIKRVDLSTGAITALTIPDLYAATGIAVAQDGTLYVLACGITGCPATDSLYAVNPATGATRLVAGGLGNPYGIAIEAGGVTALVTTKLGSNAQLVRVNLSTGAVTPLAVLYPLSTSLPSGLGGLSIKPGGAVALVTILTGLEQVDLSTGAVTVIPYPTAACDVAWGIAALPDGANALMGCGMSSPTLVSVNLTTGALTNVAGQLPFLAGVTGIALKP